MASGSAQGGAEDKKADGAPVRDAGSPNSSGEIVASDWGASPTCRDCSPADRIPRLARCQPTPAGPDLAFGGHPADRAIEVEEFATDYGRPNRKPGTGARSLVRPDSCFRPACDHYTENMSDVTRLIDAAATGDPRAAADLIPLVYAELRRWPPPSWPTSGRKRPWTPRRWSTRPTCGWSAGTDRPTGAAGATSSPPRPRPCAASWSRKPAAGSGSATAAAEGSRAWPIWTWPPRPPTTTFWPSTRPWTDSPRPTRGRPSWSNFRFFAGLTGREAAEVMNISPRKADQIWAYARAWLLECLNDDPR